MKIFEIVDRIDANSDPVEIIIQISSVNFNRSRCVFVTESMWVDAGYKDWKFRVDPEDPRISGKRHIHISRDKHTNAKNMQASWNDDGSRHDKKSFNQSIGKMNRIQDIARRILEIPNNIVLEHIVDGKSENHSDSDVSFSSDGTIAYVNFL